MDMFSMLSSSSSELPSQDDLLYRFTESTSPDSNTPSATFYQPWNSYGINTTSPSRVAHRPPSSSSLESYCIDTSPPSRVAHLPSSSSSPSSNVTQLSSSTTISPGFPSGLLSESFYPISSLTSSSTSYASTPDKEVRNMDDSGNSSGISSDSSPLSQSSDISHPTTSPSSSPVLPKSSSSPEESRIKKNNRTNYSPRQVRCLEKIFLETPYPEPEVMEQLSRNLGIPEKNLKIWFQNKRARWRKRVQNNKPTFPPVYSCYPAPMPSTVSAYSIMSPSSLMSPVVPSPVTSRSIYNLPSTTSTTVNKVAHPTQFPSYTYPPYILPQY